MKSRSLQELYMDELKVLYDAKKKIHSALPRMHDAASSPELRALFEAYQGQTRGQINRLKRIFRAIGTTPKASKRQSDNMILSNGGGCLRHDALPQEVDAALIAAAQRAVDDEMICCGCVRTYARLLYFDEAATLLQESLDEAGDLELQLRALAIYSCRNRMNATEVTVQAAARA